MKYFLPLNYVIGHQLIKDWKIKFTIGYSERSSLASELNKHLKEKIEVKSYHNINSKKLNFKKGAFFRINRVDTDQGEIDTIGLIFEKNTDIEVDNMTIKTSKNVTFKVSPQNFHNIEFEFSEKKLAPKLSGYNYDINDSGYVIGKFEKELNVFICPDEKCKNNKVHNNTDKFCSICGSKIIPGTIKEIFGTKVYLAITNKYVRFETKGEYTGLTSKYHNIFVTSMSNRETKGTFHIRADFIIGKEGKFEVVRYGRSINRNGYALENLTFPVYFSEKDVKDEELKDNLLLIGTATSYSGAKKICTEYWQKLYDEGKK